KPRDAAFSRALSSAAHKALVPAIRFAAYPSTGLPVKLSHVAYLASQRTPGTNSSTKTKSAFIGFFCQCQPHDPVDHFGKRQPGGCHHSRITTVWSHARQGINLVEDYL